MRIRLGNLTPSSMKAFEGVYAGDIGSCLIDNNPCIPWRFPTDQVAADANKPVSDCIRYRIPRNRSGIAFESHTESKLDRVKPTLFLSPKNLSRFF